jgi:hypothetical protein
MNDAPTRVCRDCGVKKPADRLNFSTTSSRYGYLDGVCRPCRKIREADRMTENERYFAEVRAQRQRTLA